jgi:hypothetical protein
MVALEPGEPLLLYIVATAEAVSMVLVAERPEPCQHQEPRNASTSGSRSQGLELVKQPRVEEVVGSQLLDVSPAQAHGGTNTAIGSQLSEVTSGLDDQESQIPEASTDPGGQGPLEPEPMEVDVPEPRPLP